MAGHPWKEDQIKKVIHRIGKRVLKNMFGMRKRPRKFIERKEEQSGSKT